MAKKSIILAFNGEAGCGKDTCAEVFIKGHRFIKLSFAAPLKQVLSKVFAVDINNFEDRKTKDAVLKTPITITKEDIDNLLDELSTYQTRDSYDSSAIFEQFVGVSISSYRQLMQVVGTDIVRNHINENMWINILESQLALHNRIVITDVRLKNERHMLKNNGATLIRVHRPGLAESTHISENDFGSSDSYDVIINNTDTKVSLQSDIDMWWSFRNKVR